MQNAPELHLGSELYYHAYLELMTTRPVGFGPAHIPWTAIIGYADELQLVGDARQDFVEIIRMVDEGYLKMMERRQKRGTQPTKGKERGR